MAYKLTYSQIPACSQGHTTNDTLSCLSCDMMHVGSNMKVYVDAKQPVPVRAEADVNKLVAGETMTCKVTYDLDGVKKEDIKVLVGDGLKLDSVEVAEKVATVKVSAEAGKFGPRSVQVRYKGVQKMFSVVLAKPEVTEDVISTVTVDPASVEVGGKATVTVKFNKPVTEAPASAAKEAPAETVKEEEKAEPKKGKK